MKTRHFVIAFSAIAIALLLIGLIHNHWKVGSGLQEQAIEAALNDTALQNHSEIKPDSSLGHWEFKDEDRIWVWDSTTEKTNPY